MTQQSIRPRLRVGFILLPRFTLTAFAGFADALRLAADDIDGSRQIDCQWAVLGDDSVEVASSCGASIKPWALMEEPRKYDYIAVVGGLLKGQKLPSGATAFLRAAARAEVPLVGLCTGSFVLARAGLLNGYEACVHWLHKDEFKKEFPSVAIETNRMFVIDRDRLTCAGGTSVVHMAAHLIEKHCTRAQAMKSSRILIEDFPLPANAWQPEAIINRQARDSVVRQAMLMIEHNLEKKHPLTRISRSLGVSMRQLQRRFLLDVEMSPVEYRQQLRLTRAKWLLGNSDRSITEIGLECGFNESSHFSSTFKKHFKMPPSRARKLARFELAPHFERTQ